MENLNLKYYRKVAPARKVAFAYIKGYYPKTLVRKCNEIKCVNPNHHEERDDFNFHRDKRRYKIKN